MSSFALGLKGFSLSPFRSDVNAGFFMYGLYQVDESPYILALLSEIFYKLGTTWNLSKAFVYAYVK